MTQSSAATAWHETPLRIKRLTCANGETVEYVLLLGDDQVAGPVWTSNGPKAALRKLLAAVLHD